MLVRLKAQEGVKKLRGKVQWEGDLAAMREGRFLNWEEDAPNERRTEPAA